MCVCVCGWLTLTLTHTHTPASTHTHVLCTPFLFPLPPPPPSLTASAPAHKQTHPLSVPAASAKGVDLPGLHDFKRRAALVLARQVSPHNAATAAVLAAAAAAAAVFLRAAIFFVLTPICVPSVAARAACTRAPPLPPLAARAARCLCPLKQRLVRITHACDGLLDGGTGCQERSSHCNLKLARLLATVCVLWWRAPPDVEASRRRGHGLVEGGRGRRIGQHPDVCHGRVTALPTIANAAAPVANRGGGWVGFGGRGRTRGADKGKGGRVRKDERRVSRGVEAHFRTRLRPASIIQTHYITSHHNPRPE